MGRGRAIVEEEEEERVDRMRWTKAAQARFVEAVDQCGGILLATPRAILDGLGLEGVTYAQVKSHLQRHRTAYIADLLERGEEVGDVSEAQLRASQALLDKRRPAGRRRPAGAWPSPEPGMQPRSQRPRSLSELPDGGDGDPMQQVLAAQAAAPAAAEPLSGAVSGSTPPSSRSSGAEPADDAAGGQAGTAATRLAGPSVTTGAAGVAQLSPAAALPSPGFPPGVLGAAAAQPPTATAGAQPGGVQGGPAARLEALLARLQGVQAAAEAVQRQQAQILATLQQHSQAYSLLRRSADDMQRQCAELYVEITQQPPPAAPPPPAPLPQPQLPAAGGPGSVDPYHLVTSLLADTQAGQPPTQQQQQQLVAPPPPAAISWEERLRARLVAEAPGALPPAPFAAVGAAQPPAATQLFGEGPAGVARVQAQGGGGGSALLAAQPAEPAGGAQPQLDETLALLLRSFPPPAAPAGGDCDVAMQLLNSTGSASGGGGGGGSDSLLGSLLRAAGGQPGVDDLAAMLSSL